MRISIDVSETGILLPGGGAAGANQIGMLHWLVHHVEAPFPYVCGTSVGALNAALYVQSWDDPPALLYPWEKLSARNVYSIWPDLFLPCGNSYVSVDPLRRTLKKFLNMERLCGSDAEGMWTATDSCTGGPVTFYNRSMKTPEQVIESLLASAAIPVLFPQVQIGKKWLEDGGLYDNTPVEPLIRAGCKTVICLHGHPVQPRTEAKPPSKWKRLSRLIYSVLSTDYARLKRTCENEKIRLVEIYPYRNIRTLDFRKQSIKDGIKSGYADAERELGRCEFVQ